jgi:hypothetical protein
VDWKSRLQNEFASSPSIVIGSGQHFAEKTPKQESQTISTALPEEVATVDEAMPAPKNGKVAQTRRVANRDREPANTLRRRKSTN